MKIIRTSTGWINLHKRYLNNSHLIRTKYDKCKNDDINIKNLDIENSLTIRVTK